MDWSYDTRYEGKLLVTLSRGNTSVALTLSDRYHKPLTNGLDVVSLAKIKVNIGNGKDYYIVGTSSDLSKNGGRENLAQAQSIMSSMGLDLSQFANAFDSSYTSGEIAYTPGSLLNYR